MPTNNTTTPNQAASKKPFGLSYPFDVLVQNQFEGKEDATLYIVDKIDALKKSQQIVISIVKKNLQHHKLIGLKEELVNSTNYNFAIAFRPGALKNSIINRLLVDSQPKENLQNVTEEAKKEAVKAKRNFSTLLYNALTEAVKDNSVSVDGPFIRETDKAFVWYCGFQKDIRNFTGLTFTLKGISAEVGEGSRPTQIEFSFNKFSIGAGTSETILSFNRMVHVNIISHQGSTHVPLYFGVLEVNTLLNQPSFKNTLDIFFETIGRVPIQFGPHTEIDFYFPYEDESNNPEVYFGTADEANDYELENKSSSLDRDYKDFSIDISHPNEIHGLKVIRVKFLPLADAHPKQYAKLSTFIFNFKNLLISGQDGRVLVGASIRNVPGYWDTDFQVPIIKGKSRINNGLLELGAMDKKGISGIDFKTSGVTKNKTVVRIEEHNGLALIGDPTHPVKVIGADFSVTGDANMEADLAVGNNLSVGSDLSVEKDITITGDANIKTNLSAGNSLSVGKDLAVRRNLAVTGDANIKTNLAVRNNLKVIKDFIVQGKVHIGPYFNGRESAHLRLHNNTVSNTVFRISSMHKGFFNQCSIAMKNYTIDDRALQFYNENSKALDNSKAFTFLTVKRKSKLTILHGGRVGIGTSNPTKAHLEIDSDYSHAQRNYIPINDQLTFKNGVTRGTAGKKSLSLYATEGIAAKIIYLFSDKRLKTIVGRSNSKEDLETLLLIEVTDFKYKDVTRGTDLHKKVIAQQVEEIFDLAVSKHTDVVPDIYKIGKYKDGWIALESNLKKGERVKLMDREQGGVFEVLEVSKDKFRTDFKSDGDTVFVYGREVDDFLMVDYNAISMLNVSATQQLKKELECLVTENTKLKEEVTLLQKQQKQHNVLFTSLLKRVERLEK